MLIMLRLKILKIKYLILTTNLATSTTLNAKINKVKKEVPNITNLATTTAYFAVKYKILGHSALSLL